ncbi:MAG: YeeE/YedE family protein [Alphaproteobacteria bacterium]|nr:YeeE/YedE family protein [Alphaproteobacteria bacterium]
MRIVAALFAGVVFGLGITVSGMINPAKVLNFFDVAGTWDPSLALVMASALATTFIGYKIVLGRSAPVLANSFQLPTSLIIDGRLLAGAAIYGVGWGLTGYCPGGAIPALGLGRMEPWIFFAALVIGILLARFGRTRLDRAQTAAT